MTETGGGAPARAETTRTRNERLRRAATRRARVDDSAADHRAAERGAQHGPCVGVEQKLDPQAFPLNANNESR